MILDRRKFIKGIASALAVIALPVKGMFSPVVPKVLPDLGKKTILSPNSLVLPPNVDFFDITGTTTITSLDCPPGELFFLNTKYLKHGNDLILPKWSISHDSR